MRLNCSLCERPALEPDGLQTWSDVLTEHLLICSIRATDGFSAHEQSIDRINKLGIHFKVMLHDKTVLFFVERSAIDPYRFFRVCNLSGVLTFRTPYLDQLVDFFRDEYGVPLPSLRR